MSSSPCRKGTADGIAQFYREILGAPACVEGERRRQGRACQVGPKQELIFRETDQKLPEFDGHHLQVYVEDFGTPHDKLEKLDLITEESDRCQYRFEDIVDLDTGKVLFTIEHEVRSMTHPLYNAAAGQPQPVADQPQLLSGRRRVGFDLAATRTKRHRPADAG